MDEIERRRAEGSPLGQTLIYTFGHGFSALDRLIIAYMLPFIIPFFGMNYTQGGFLVTMMAVGYTIMGVLGGTLSDRYGRKRITLPMIIIFSLLSFVTGFVKHVVVLILVRTVLGGAEGAYGTAAPAHISDIAPPEKRGFYLGMYNAAFAILGSFLGPLYAMNVAGAWGWQWACFLTIIPGVILAICAKIFIKESPRYIKGTREYEEAAAARKGKQEKVSLAEVVKVRNVLIAIGVTMTYFIWNWSWLSFGTSYFIAEHGYSEQMSGTLMSLFGLGGFVGMMTIPRLSDNIGRKKVLPIGGGIALVFTLVIIFVPLSYGALCACIMIASFGAWGCLPVMMLIIPTESVKPEWAGAAVGITMGFGELIGIAVAPTLLGVIGDMYNLSYSMIVGACGLVAMIIISFFLKETAPKLVKRYAESDTAVQ